MSKTDSKKTRKTRLSEVKEVSTSTLLENAHPSWIDHLKKLVKRCQSGGAPHDAELLAYAFVGMKFANMTPESICFLGFNEDQKAALDALYRPKYMHHRAYLQQAIRNPVAAYVLNQHTLELYTDDTAMEIDHMAKLFLSTLDKVHRGDAFSCDDCGAECIMIKSMANTQVMVATDQLLDDWDFENDYFSPMIQTEHYAICPGPARKRLPRKKGGRGYGRARK